MDMQKYPMVPLKCLQDNSKNSAGYITLPSPAFPEGITVNLCCIRSSCSSISLEAGIEIQWQPQPNGIVIVPDMSLLQLFSSYKYALNFHLSPPWESIESILDSVSCWFTFRDSFFVLLSLPTGSKYMGIFIKCQLRSGHFS